MDTVSPSWQKSLYAIAVAEFIVLAGFNSVSPIMPLFVQQLGNFAGREAAFWAGLATGASGLGGFLAAPMWGLVADRWGRKPMLLRSQFGSALVVALAGLSPNIYALVGLRLIHGVLSGTIAAASALVASQTPRDKMPFAMGLLMVAAFGGSTIGPFLGGTMADSLGLRDVFFLSSGLLIVGGVIVLFLVQERFDRTQRPQRTSAGSVLRLATSRDMLPLLFAMCALQAGPQALAPVIPLFIKALEPGGQAATASGVAFGFMGVLAALSAVAASRLGGRLSLKKILVYSCIGTSILYLPPMLAMTVTQLVILIVLTGLLKGGFMTSTNALIGLSVPTNQQGIAYGIAHSAQSLGNGLGPLLGGSLASLLGLRAIFPVTAALFLLVGILVGKYLSGKDLPETRPSKTASG